MKISILVFSSFILFCSDVKKTHPIKDGVDWNFSSKTYTLNSQLGMDNFPEEIENFTDSIKLFSDLEIGLISDVTIDKLGRLYVLDEKQQLIFIFDESGNLIQEIGGRGRGPNEFERAKTFVNYKDQLLIVGNGYRIDIYDISNEVVKYENSIKVKEQIHTICSIGDKLFANKKQVLPPGSESETDKTNLIIAYNLPDIKELQNFGQAYLSTNGMVVDRLSTGNLSCNEESNTVLFTFDKIPYIHGYDAIEGELRWVTHLDELSLSKIIENNEGGKTRLTYEIPKEGIIDQLHPTLTIDGKYELVQVDRRYFKVDNLERKQEILSYLINSDDGKGVSFAKELPVYIMRKNGMVVALSEDYTNFSIRILE